jgi:hypothetical protein
MLHLTTFSFLPVAKREGVDELRVALAVLGFKN